MERIEKRSNEKKKLSKMAKKQKNFGLHKKCQNLQFVQINFMKSWKSSF